MRSGNHPLPQLAAVCAVSVPAGNHIAIAGSHTDPQGHCSGLRNFTYYAEVPDMYEYQVNQTVMDFLKSYAEKK